MLHAELDFQIALNLLLWGEAANLRLCPEFLCWAYHKTAKRLRDAIADKEPEQFIRYISRFCGALCFLAWCSVVNGCLPCSCINAIVKWKYRGWCPRM